MALTTHKKTRNNQKQKDGNNVVQQHVMKNARDVSQIIIAKKNKFMECFEKVIEICQVQITRAAENNFTHCIFEVPTFILGYPIYDINECIVYVLKRLKENDYQVSYFFPNIIYIMWPVEEEQLDHQYKQLLNILNNNSMMQNSSPLFFNQRIGGVGNTGNTGNTRNEFLPHYGFGHGHRFQDHTFSDPPEYAPKSFPAVGEKKTKGSKPLHHVQNMHHPKSVNTPSVNDGIKSLNLNRSLNQSQNQHDKFNFIMDWGDDIKTEKIKCDIDDTNCTNNLQTNVMNNTHDTKNTNDNSKNIIDNKNKKESYPPLPVPRSTFLPPLNTESTVNIVDEKPQFYPEQEQEQERKDDVKRAPSLFEDFREDIREDLRCASDAGDKKKTEIAYIKETKETKDHMVSKQSRKKKETKPVSEYTTNKKFVLDLSLE